MTLLAAEAVQRFGLDAEGGAAVAFQLRHGRHARAAQDAGGAAAVCARMRRSWRWRARCRPISPSTRRSAPELFPDSRLKGQANLLIMPTLDAANIALQPAPRRSATGCRSGRCWWGRRSRRIS